MKFDLMLVFMLQKTVAKTGFYGSYFAVFLLNVEVKRQLTVKLLIVSKPVVSVGPRAEKFNILSNDHGRT